MPGSASHRGAFSPIRLDGGLLELISSTVVRNPVSVEALVKTWRFEAMKRLLFFPLVLLILLSGLLVTSTTTVQAAMVSNCVTPGMTTTMHGTLGGANYTISVPANWNGTLALYSHGYAFATSPLANPAPDAGDAVTAAALLQQGYALAGSSY